jgi:hypothetical protein
MSYQIEPRKVAGVVIEANQAITGKGFNHGEVVLGLSELMGRIIVDAVDTQIQAEELVAVASAHLKQTIMAGGQAKGKRIITGV